MENLNIVPANDNLCRRGEWHSPMTGIRPSPIQLQKCIFHKRMYVICPYGDGSRNNGRGQNAISKVGMEGSWNQWVEWMLSISIDGVNFLALQIWKSEKSTSLP